MTGDKSSCFEFEKVLAIGLGAFWKDDVSIHTFIQTFNELCNQSSTFSFSSIHIEWCQRIRKHVEHRNFLCEFCGHRSEMTKFCKENETFKEACVGWQEEFGLHGFWIINLC